MYKRQSSIIFLNKSKATFWNLEVNMSFMLHWLNQDQYTTEMHCFCSTVGQNIWIQAADLMDGNVLVWLDPAPKDPMIASPNFGTNNLNVRFTSPGRLQEPAWRWTGGCTTPDPTPAAGALKSLHKCVALLYLYLISYICSTFNNLLQRASWVPRSPNRLHTLTSSLELAGRRPRSLSLH